VPEKDEDKLRKGEMYPHGGSRYRNIIRRDTSITRRVFKKNKSDKEKGK
jgi:hypothetical protein